MNPQIFDCPPEGSITDCARCPTDIRNRCVYGDDAEYQVVDVSDWRMK